MRALLQNPAFVKVFAAQILSLLAIGVMTVSLSLMAFDLGGISFGGLVFGGVLALKMVAYVVVAPIAEAVLSQKPRRTVLIGLSVARVIVMLAMALLAAPAWAMLLSFVVFAASSGFTPLVQAIIPEILPQEALYARALALWRVAYTVEAFLSPVVAGLLLGLVTPQWLLFVPALFFLASTALVVAFVPPAGGAPARAPFAQRVLRGARITIRTPRLRGLWLVQFALTLPLASVLVNSVVYAGLHSETPDTLYPRLMMCYGLGTACGAFLVPVLLPRLSERVMMLSGAFLFAAFGFSLIASPPVAMAFAVWAALGFASSLALTPGGLVITRSAAPANRPALFAAQFALSHAGWLIAYPLAGALGAWLGPESALALLSASCVAVLGMALSVWPARDDTVFAHAHDDLPDGHPHLVRHGRTVHRHAYFIDDLHPHWPQSRG